MSFSLVYGENEIILNPTQDIYRINSAISYLKDDNRELQFHDILTPSTQQKFKKLEHNMLGYYHGNVWIKIEARCTDSSTTDWILHHNWSLTDSIFFYSYDKNSTWTSVLMGRRLPYSMRIYKQPTFGLPLNFSSSETQTFYLKLISLSSPLAIRLSIEKERFFIEQEYGKSTFYGLYFGALICMFLYNFFIFLFLRDRSYFYYLFSIICTLVIFSGVSGYAFKFIWPNAPLMNKYVVHVAMGCMIIFNSLFTNAILETKKYFPFMIYVFRLMMVLALVATILSVIGVKSSLVNTLLTVYSFILLFTGIFVWKKGNSIAIYYVIAWFLFILGGVIITLSNIGLLPATPITRHMVEFGSAMEVMLLSLALAYKYRAIRLNSELAQRRALELEKNAKEKLEIKVAERTQKLQETAEELHQQSIELHTINDNLINSQAVISKKHQQLTNNIKYAARIQEALVTEMTTIFPQHFVVSAPKDIVTGDFYWAGSTPDKKIIALADCTGHGTSAAFVTLLGSMLLNRIVNELHITNPKEILELLDKEVNKLFKSDQQKGLSDGMDIAIVVFDKHENSLHFAGANSSLYMVNQGELTKLKGARVPIGFSRRFKNKVFTDTTIRLFNGNNMFYLSSDGYKDQFGGELDQKLGTKRFEKLLREIAHQPIRSQKEEVIKQFQDWKGEKKQIDDILVVGFKYKKG